MNSRVKMTDMDINMDNIDQPAKTANYAHKIQKLEKQIASAYEENEAVIRAEVSRLQDEYESGKMPQNQMTRALMEQLTAKYNAKRREMGQNRGAPSEMFQNETMAIKKSDDEEANEDENHAETHDGRVVHPSKQLDALIQLYYTNKAARMKPGLNHELEVRFGTKGVRPITKTDYDQVVKTLKSLGFTTNNPNGLFSLRIRCEFLDSVSGRFKMSDVRTEIDGLNAIEKYCRSNDLKQIYKDLPHNVRFMHKKPVITDNKTVVRPVSFNDFNFRVSYQYEEKAKTGIENYILENWRKSKKEFRYLNRVSFVHPDYPVTVDISIVKMGNTQKTSRGHTFIIPVYTLEESNVLNNREIYEIEIEVDNTRVGGFHSTFDSPSAVGTALRKVIKFVLSGLQGTMYPISYMEQGLILREYMEMIWGKEFDPTKRIRSGHFIGPNSVTLQLTHVAPLDENIYTPNIRKDFVVTEKADGERHLMYISRDGRIYLISTNMDVKFTGAITTNEDCYHTLMDGELIRHDKNGEYIHLYAAFDLYFHRGKDVRHYTFMLKDDEENVFLSRYYLLSKIGQVLKPVSILDLSREKLSKKEKEKTDKTATSSSVLSPIRFDVKKFFPNSEKQSIFDGCRYILQKQREGLFEYEVDGLIFTHAFYGVGSNEIGKAGPRNKITWEYSFKWKPPQYNTIDFLVTTTKNPNGTDVVRSLFEDGVNVLSDSQYNAYKTIELRCGFSEKHDGFINPCQDLIDDRIPEYRPRLDDEISDEYVPKRFYPTDPYDPNAGISHIALKADDVGALQMFTQNGEVFTDNTIVEFSYHLEGKEGWRWIPLRVRYDKTGKLMRGEREYGNAYKVCNENWRSIHPTGRITEEMLETGMNIPEVSVSEDIYYNTPAGKMKTEALKNFHNLYVKKMLIVGVSKRGDTLIDFACGKAGDLSKWISAKLSFVFGIDYSEDNLENRLDGACARYLKASKSNKVMPSAMFVHGDSGRNIQDGSAMRNDKAKRICDAIFGKGVKDAVRIGRGVAKLYGKGEGGFQVSSCQFAIHYFFKNPDTLKGFLRNVAECTKLNGYFIGTSYDGKQVFKELRRLKTGESFQLAEDGKKIWEMVKMYGSDQFDDDSSCLSYEISVYQESINQHITEYLVNYTYLDRLMSAFGFQLISKEEATEMGLPSASGMFDELYTHMLDELKRNRFKETMFGNAPHMTVNEKKISFLNRFFVYKKVREVHLEKIQLDFGEYDDMEQMREKEATQHAVQVAKEFTEPTAKPKVRKLRKKLALVPATEGLEDIAPIPEPTPAPVASVPEKKKRAPRAPKDPNQPKPAPKPRKLKTAATNAPLSQPKLLIIEEDEDET